MIFQVEQWQATDGKAVSVINFKGDSSESKPTDVAAGSTFYEIDTKKKFMFSGERWIEQS